MANATQNALLQTLFQGMPGQPEPEDNGMFSPVMDPEVRKRLQLGYKMGQEAKANKQAVEVPPDVAPQASAAGQNPFTSKYSVTSSIMSPEDRAQHRDMQIQFKDLLAQQQAGIDKQNQSISDIKTNARNDWVVPAAGFLDQTFGGNQTAVAKAWSGMSPEERAQEIAKMEGNINQQRSSMSNQVKSLIDSNNTMKMAEAADKNNRFQQGQDMRLNMAFDRSVQGATKGAFESMQSIGAIENIFNSPDGQVPVGEARAMLSNASRLLGERGVLTDSDIERVQINTLQSQLQSLMAKISGQPDNQRVPVENYRSLINAISQSKQAMGAAVQQRLNAIGQSYKTYGARPEVVDTVINQNYLPRITTAFGVPQVPMGQTAMPKMAPQPNPPGVNQKPMPKGSGPGGRLTLEEFRAWKAGN